MMTTLRIVFLLLFGFATNAVTARNATLLWDAVPDPDIVKYTAYWGTASRTYTGKQEVPVGTTQAKIEGLDEGKIYYFAVTASNAR